MVEMKDIVTLDNIEDITNAYLDNINTAIDMYCLEKDIDKKDIYNIDQSRWNSILLYIFSKVFKVNKKDKRIVKKYNEKSNIDYSDKELINNVIDIYVSLCYEYSKEVSVMGFSKLTGIDEQTMYTWHNDALNGRNSFDAIKKLRAEREESLSAKLVSCKGNPTGLLGILNRHYGWNMGQPKNVEQQIAPRSPEQIAADYGVCLVPAADKEEKPTEKAELPKIDF